MSTDTRLTARSKRPSPAKNVTVEIVADNRAMDLAAIQQGIADEQEKIDLHMSAAKEAMLPHALRIGLLCLQAQELLALSPTERARAGGKAKAALSDADKAGSEALSVADKASSDAPPGSFKAWFQAEVKGVSRSNAYSYLRAVKGLGLDHTASPKDIDKALSKARKEAGQKKLSIAKLAHLGGPLEGSDDGGGDQNTSADKAGEARVFVAAWKARWDLGVKAGNIEDLEADDLKDLEDFLRHTLDHVKRRAKSARAA